MMSCKEFSELITEYIEGNMPMSKRMSFWLHKTMCGPCNGYMKQIQFTARLMGQLPNQAPQEELREMVLERLRTLNQEDEA